MPSIERRWQTMKRIVYIILLLVFLPPQSAFANGGPGESYSLLAGGNIKFTDTPDILVEKENLNIVLSPRTSVVTAEYTLKNTGPARELNYIFPITQYVAQDYGEGNVEWIAFYDGARKLSFTETREQIPKEADGADDGIYRYYTGKHISVDKEEVYYNYVKNYYYQTKLSFSEGETKVLNVSYKTSNYFLSGGTSKSLLSAFSNVVFLYDLTPAASWGDGKAGEFNLTIDYNELYLVDDLTVNMEGFSRQPSGIYRYSSKDFDFAKQGRISAIFYYPFELEQLEYHREDIDMLYKFFVSSTLAGANDAYSAVNLFDDDPDTPWSSDGKGVGETMEFLFAGSNAMIGILNGHIKSEELYYDNARIKKVKVERAYGNREAGEIQDIWEYEIDFPDIPYMDIEKNNLFKHLTLISTDGTPDDYIRLTVLEAYPGRKHKDLCISEIYLFPASDDSATPHSNNEFKLSAISIFDNYADIVGPIDETPPSNSSRQDNNASSQVAPSQSEDPPSDELDAPDELNALGELDENAEPAEDRTLSFILVIVITLALCAGLAVYMRKKRQEHE
jgi:hypothetical protein